MTTETQKIDFSALGTSRLNCAKTATTQEEWAARWPKVPESPIRFGSCWKQFVQYSVNDVAAEIGFFIDCFGFKPNAFGEDFVMFTNDAREFYFSVVPAAEDKATPTDSINLSFMIQDIEKVVETLQSRGAKVLSTPTPQGNDQLLKAVLETPNGIPVEIWEFKEDS